MMFGAIEKEAARVREKYNPGSLLDLENVAKQEYGIKTISTPFDIYTNRIICRHDDAIFILYSCIKGESSKYSVAHEIGHYGAGHFNGVKREKNIAELEANAFASTLLGMNHLAYFLKSIYVNIKIGYDMGKNPEQYPQINDEELLRIGSEFLSGDGRVYDEELLMEISKNLVEKNRS